MRSYGRPAGDSRAGSQPTGTANERDACLSTPERRPRCDQPRRQQLLNLLDAHHQGDNRRDTPVYAELMPPADAAALVAASINVALASERGRHDLSTGFRLHPVAVDSASAAGRPYRVLRWGVFVVDPDYADTGDPFADLVNYGAVRRRRDGQLRYDHRGLHDPLAADELDQLLAVAGDPRTSADLLSRAEPARPGGQRSLRRSAPDRSAPGR